jgi:putative ABC transport system ATP-binding protein
VIDVEPAIALDVVSKRHGEGPTAVAALSDVTLAVQPGEWLAVLGPSGSGKSTLLNLIAGLDAPTTGRVVVAGRDLAALSDDALSALRLREIGFVFQAFNLLPTLTAEENVAWPLAFLGVSWRDARRRAAGLLSQVGIAGAAQSRRPAFLSGGEQQRVAVARALVADPRVLLADEPTGNLDSETATAILDLLVHVSEERGLTVILVTHNPIAAARAGRVVRLRDGRVVADTAATTPDHGRRATSS